MKKSLAMFLTALILSATHCTAQNLSSSVTSSLNDLNDRIDQAVASSLPEMPRKPVVPQEPNFPNSTSSNFDREGMNTDSAYLNIFGGPVLSLRNGNPQASGLIGVTFGEYFARTFGKGESLSPQFELGIIGPIPDGYPMDGFVSMDYMLGNKIPAHHQYISATAGYTRFFVTGDAINAGLSFDFGQHEYDRLLRIELRDYILLDGPRQNILSLRFAFGKFVYD